MQETASLPSTNWMHAVRGTINPALILNSNPATFYR